MIFFIIAGPEISGLFEITINFRVNLTSDLTICHEGMFQGREVYTIDRSMSQKFQKCLFFAEFGKLP